VFHPATPEQVAAYEEANGITLPDDYRRFLVTDAPHPGTQFETSPPGEVLPSLKIYCAIEYGWFDEFCCFNPDRPWLELTGCPFLSNFEGGIAIAFDEGDRPWVMSVIGPDYGYVYYCHQFDCRDDMVLVAKSFTEFLSLVEPPNAAELHEQHMQEDYGPEPFKYPPAGFQYPEREDSPPEAVGRKRWWEYFRRSP
jgi:hypothetical protein